MIKKPYVLESVENATPNSRTFRFKSQDGAAVDFTPGMFVMLYYRNSETGEEIGRAYSIANAPPSDYFEFTISMIHGMLTSKLEAAKPGDVYYISGPYGQFKIEFEEGSKVLLLAGGSGVVPFVSMIKRVKKMGGRVDADLIYSVRYPTEVIYSGELQDDVSKLGMKLIVTVTRPAPGDGWTGQTGHIDAEMIKKYVPDLAERTCFLCGPPKFVSAVKDALVSLGVDRKAIHSEMWGE
jgi:ferredoxin-NADP reductase